MVEADELVVKIIPAMTVFYNKSQTLDDRVMVLTGKVMDSMSITHNLYKRWGSTNG